MTRPILAIALFLAVALIHLVTAGSQFDVERGELRELSSEIEGLKLRLIRDLRNKDLTINVTALEASVGDILDKIEKLTAKLDANTAAIANKCNATTCKTIQVSVAKHDTCFGDVNSKNCPSSPANKTGVLAGIKANTAAIDNMCNATTCKEIKKSVMKHETCFGDVKSEQCPSSSSDKTGVLARIEANTKALDSKCNSSKCGSIEGKVTKAEGCLANTSSSNCPPAAKGIKGIKDAITALEKPYVFNCAFLGGDVGLVKIKDILSPYECNVNVGDVVTKDNGQFNVKKTGKYRLTFMAVYTLKDDKFVTATLVKTTGVEKTEMAKSVAKSNNAAKEEEQVTTTIDIVWELVKGDIVTVKISFEATSISVISGPKDKNAPRQVVFTGEYIGL